ncbi:muscle M-line assembly protein unc-89 [Galleria mellonella]|uniref:Muscle M-line assembly protein unc-89 n=1 Tax=Galleria mellonella TaxID=7137 RepID=A0A6J1WXD8_GALME|nr:muscle M-line assembly protein unc-89 [Galleria mellonella]
MSTRSGKRIHASFHESEVPVDTELVCKKEKKTRNKPSKENLEDTVSTVTKSKKRNNYVSYPTDDDVTSESGVTNENEGQQSRVLRRNMLKEQNLNVPNGEVEKPMVDVKKIIRQTRRTRKFSEDNIETVTDQEECIPEVVMETATGKVKGKKNKKKKAKSQSEVNGDKEKIVSKKQSKKKRKKTTSKNDCNVEESSVNKSDMSVDSFHSAAGSSLHDDYGVNHEINVSFDKSSKGVIIVDRNTHDNVTSENGTKTKKKSSTFEVIYTSINKDKPKNSHKNPKIVVNEDSELHNMNNTFGKETRKKRKPNARSDTNVTEKVSGKNSDTYEKLNTTFEKETNGSSSKILNSTFEKPNERESLIINITPETGVSKRKSFRSNSEAPKLFNSTFDEPDIDEVTNLNSTFEKDICNINNSIKKVTKNLNTTSEKDNSTKSGKIASGKFNNTFEKSDQKIKTSISGSDTLNPLNSTFEKSNKNGVKINTTFDKDETNLNTTFDKTTANDSTSKSSLITSDDSENLTFDKIADNTRISVSDDSRTENIVNTTPVLIDSSMDNSRTSSEANKTSMVNVPLTPLKREGTFTKDGPEAGNDSFSERTPSKQMSLSTPGSTPFPFSKSSQREKSVLNVTRSIEKTGRLSVSLDTTTNAPTRTTRVMFCSPVNNPAVVMQHRRKVIKSNLKGSNKSFIVNDDDNARSPAPRKRSYTHNDAENERAKRKRLADDQQLSVDRLSRPRTSGAAGKPEPVTPSKKIPTPSKSKSDTKISRTKLPNFAALHQRRFEKMESLDECQERKAKRARQLLVPTAPITVLERSSPRVSPTSSEPPMTKEAKKMDLTTVKKSETPTKKLPTLDSLRPGYTRFGFKMNLEVNPFSITSKNVMKPKDNKPKGALVRQATLPSLTGTTTSRREIAKQTVMREKSFTHVSEKRDIKRKENRCIIKGVRTNRRFDLQMKMRNMEA